jgi:Kef-type K+ transport system membrane component KefB
MAPWAQYLIALVALIVLTPLVAVLAKRFGAKAKGGVMLAGILLGVGNVADQPAKHAMEATEKQKGSPENGDPP